MEFVNETFDLLHHSQRVSSLSYKLAKQLKLPENKCKEIAIAGYFHDIGKFLLQPHILNKKEKLAKEEFEYIKSHSKLGSKILKDFKISKYILLCVYQHHENFDGTGYPDNLKEDEILLGAKIIRICDTFDALTMDRPYRKGSTIKDALEIMKNDKSLYDIKIFNSFLTITGSKEFNYNKELVI